MIEAVIFAAVSTLLYHLGLGPMLFLVPLQAALVRNGKKTFAASLLIAAVMILGVWLLKASRSPDPMMVPVVIVSMTMAALLMGGLVLIQLPELVAGLERYRYPRVLRLAAATGIAGLLSVPVILYAGGNEAFMTGLRESMSWIAVLLQGGSDAAGLSPGAWPGQAQAMGIFDPGILLRIYLFEYFFLLTSSWWLGSILGARSIGRSSGITRIVDFRLPDVYIWPFLGSLALVMANAVVPLGVLGIAAWNTLLIMAFLYGLAGLGIVRFLLRKYRSAVGFHWLMIPAIIIMVVTMVFLLFPVLIAGLGVSEIWLKYRSKERSNA